MTAVTFQSLIVLLFSGIAAGAVIDGIRLLKERIPYVFAKHWYVVELVAWLAIGACTFYLLYRWQDGHWRWVNFCAQIVGIYLYDRYLFRVIRLVTRIIVYSIITPFLFLCGIIWRIIIITARIIKKLLNIFSFKWIR